MKASNVLALLTTALMITFYCELFTFGVVAGLFYGMMSELVWITLYSYAVLLAPVFMFIAAILIYLDEKKDREWKKQRQRVKKQEI